MNGSRLLWPAGVGVVLLGVTVGMRTRSVPPASAIQAADTSRPAMSSPLLRRLAAAADGYRTGQVVWVVIFSRAPYTVKGVYAYRGVADSITKAAGEGWRTVPVQTVPDPLGQSFAVIKHCYPTILPCFDPLVRPSIREWPVENVDSVSITVYPHSGPSWRGKIDPREVDAVFFNIAAIDKFVIPYYSGLEGPAAAVQLRESIGRQLGP